MPRSFEPVCRLADLEVGRGAAALVHGQAIAIFRLADDRVVALGNHDPFSRTSVLARGLTGTRVVPGLGSVDFVASAAHRHTFDLATGHCLDEPSVSVPSFEVRIVDGTVEVGPRAERRASA